MAHYLRIGALIALGCWLNSHAAATDNDLNQQPEQLLTQAVAQLKAQQTTDALATLNQLIQGYPHFQLAQMMRADLLYAQTNTLTQIGAQLSNKQTQQLQAEARARLNAVTRLAEQQQPVYILGAAPNWLRNLITIDLAASRAYFFNLEQGQLVFKTSFYLTQGSLGAGKEKEGDKRTPIGIYRLEKPIPSQKLSNFYGAGALPLDYPNSWDKRNNRTGHGIWLHGTPFEQYSRPPLASDGCVVFSNDDMGYLLKSLDWKSTRVVTDNQLAWKNAETEALAQQLSQRLSAWRLSWEQQQLTSYLAFYAPDFTSQKGENKSQWTTRKQQLFALNQTHHIQINGLLLLRYPSQGDLVVAEFDQRYQRGSKIDVERKRLWWQQQQGEWLILHEEILSN